MRVEQFIVTRMLEDDDPTTREQLHRELMDKLNATQRLDLTTVDAEAPGSDFTGRRHRPVLRQPPPPAAVPLRRDQAPEGRPDLMQLQANVAAASRDLIRHRALLAEAKQEEGDLDVPDYDRYDPAATAV